jgi:hypothetical protein
LKGYAKAMGGEVFDEYVDGGFSGGSTLYGVPVAQAGA